MQSLEDEAPNVDPFHQGLPVWMIETCAHPVENSVQPQEQIVDYSQMLASNSTVESFMQDLNWEHSYAIPEASIFETFTSNENSTSRAESPVPSSISETSTSKENSTCPTESPVPPSISETSTSKETSTCRTESPVPPTIGNCTLGLEYRRTPPTSCHSRTNLTAKHTSPTISLPGSSSTSYRVSPLVNTPMGNVRRVAEPSCASSYLPTPKTTKVGKKRSIVPPLDAFAKKIKAAGNSDATEDAIIECPNDLRAMSSEFTGLLRLKKKLIKAQLQAGKPEVEKPKKSFVVESGEGFFQLLQEEWVQLPVEIQDELFPDMLDIMEEFEA